MRRFLAWIVMILCFSVADTFGFMITSLILFILTWLGDEMFGVLFFIVMSTCIGFFIFLGLVFPLTFGPRMIVSASEAVCPSRKGTRYKTCSILFLTFIVLSAILMLFGEMDFDWTYIYEAIFSIALLLQYKNHLTPIREKKKTEFADSGTEAKTQDDNNTFEWKNQNSKYAEVRSWLDRGRVAKAEMILDEVQEYERSAEWYYLKGCASLHWRRGYVAQKYFYEACMMEPNNVEYRTAIRNLYNRAVGFWKIHNLKDVLSEAVNKYKDAKIEHPILFFLLKCIWILSMVLIMYIIGDGELWNRGLMVAVTFLSFVLMIFL